MKTYNVDGAAEVLNVSAETMKDLASRGAVPGAKIGKCWVFVEDDLIDYLRSEIIRQTAERRGQPNTKVATAFQKSTAKRRQFKAPPSLTIQP